MDLLHFSLHRESLLRKDPGQLHALLTHPQARVIGVWKELPMLGERHFLPLASLAGQAQEALVFLGIYQDWPTFALPLTRCEAPFRESDFGDIRQNAAQVPAETLAIAIQAKALCSWHLSHGFCARCGQPTVPADAGYRRHCPACGADHFPRCDPAVIVGVEFGGKILLGRQASWPEKRYSVIAGFAEAGETLEQAVVREVMEETGVRVSRVRYLDSQPWPYPSSLMLAFEAEAEGDQLTLHDQELEHALWLSRAEFAGRIRAQTLLAPPRVSIASRIIRRWYEREGAALAELYPPS